MVFCFLGATEVAIILIVALLVFGPQKLPEVGKQIGSVWREMNRMRNDVERMLDMDDVNNRYDRTPYYTPNDTIYPQITGPLEESETHEAEAHESEKRLSGEHGTEFSENHGEPGGVENATLVAGTHHGVGGGYHGTQEGDGTAETHSLAPSVAPERMENAVHSAIPGINPVKTEPEVAPDALSLRQDLKEDSGASHENAQERKNDV